MSSFYELREPEYETDDESDLANPIRQIESYHIPGIICSVCHDTWGGSRRLYIPITNSDLQQKLNSYPLQESEWRELEQSIRQSTGLPDDFLLQPGDTLGTPSFELLAFDLPDFMHPFPGQMIVKRSVVHALQRAELTGYHVVSIKVKWSKGLQEPLTPLPELYEIMVDGSAWRVDSTPESITACPHCKRKIFPDPDWLRIDESRWDHTDIFHPDFNTNMVIITDRFCRVLADERMSNYWCKEI